MQPRILIFLTILTSFCMVGKTQGDEKSFLSSTRQLIYEGKRSGEGYFSKSGRYLIFQSEREKDNPFYQMYILDFETGDIERVSPGHGKTTCGYFNWAREEEVLFASSHRDAQALAKQKAELDFRASGKKRRYSWDYEPEMDIYTFHRSGEELQNLTNTLGYDAEASFSPDGAWIAFTSNRQAFMELVTEEVKKQLSFDPSFYNEIYLMRSDGSDVRRLTDYDGYDGGPFFSPDGQRIIWRRFNKKGDKADIFTMKVDGTDVQQLTEFRCMSWAPFYHPSQKYILFASNKLGFSNFELFMVDVEGKKEPIQVTFTDGFDGLPVFSPDGTKLVWTSNRTASGHSQLFLANWNHLAALAAIDQAPNRGQTVDFQPEVKASELEQKVTYLASDELGGRMTGTDGAKLAADYAIQQFSSLGLKPFVNGDYRIPFPFSAKITVDQANTDLQYDAFALKDGKEFTPLLFSDSGTATGQGVFAGYGITIPGEDGYNSYRGLDVNDKIVFVVEEIPHTQDDDFNRDLSRYSSLRYRTLLAREAGAKAIVIIGDIESEESNTLAASAGILAAKISLPVARSWFKNEQINLDSLVQNLSTFNPHLDLKATLKKSLHIKITLGKEKKLGHNVVAMLTADKPTDKYLVVGAHYDHLGLGESGSLLADNNHDQIHNGADDNASGTALVLEMAEFLVKQKREEPEKFNHNILFALWSGEELGLIGSSAFCEIDFFQNQIVKAYLNFDMVGRMKENRLILQGLGSAIEWRSIAEKKNIVHGFNLVLQEDPFLPTDATSFYKKQIPVMSFFTGLHDDYHRPSDDASTVNYPDLARVTKFSNAVLLELLDSEITYQKVDMSESQQNIRSFSVYLGTIPDYAAEVVGVKLSGVRPGAPSDEAGLKAGDIIIELAGKEIRNIYDYTYILGDLEIGKKEKIIVLRDGERMELDITPGSK